MRRRKTVEVAAAWAALAEIEAAAFVRLIAVVAGANAAVLGAIAIVTVPRTASLLLLIGFAVAAGYSAYRVWRKHGDEPPSGTLALLLVVSGIFVFALPSAGEVLAARLVQVTAVALAAATVLAALLRWRWRVGPRAALTAAAILACEVVLLEAVVGVTHTNAPAAMMARADWVGLRAASGSRRPADTLVAASSLWSAAAEVDSQLGVRFRAGSSLKTLYADNPRGYFTRGDFRRDIWELGVADGSKADLLIPDAQGQLRVAISAAARGVPEWQIRLDQFGLELEAAKPYRLDFRARADRPRSAIVAVTQGAGEFALLGLLDTLALTPEWQTFRLYLTPARDERNARIHFALGGHEPSVDLAGVELRSESIDQPVMPYSARHPWTIEYRFNAFGCRGDVAAEPRAGEYRIVMLGDGFTMGVGVHEADAFARRLETLRRANATQPAGSVRVMNCGVPGYGTSEQEQFYTRLASWRPQQVVLVMGTEVDRLHWEAKQRALRQLGRTRAEQLFTTWSVAKRLWLTRRTYDYERSVADVMRLRDSVTQHDGRLVVVVAQTDASPEWRRLRDAMSEGLRDAGVPVIDASDALAEGRPWDQTVVHATDPHPDERVHAALARLLAKELQLGTPP